VQSTWCKAPGAKPLGQSPWYKAPGAKPMVQSPWGKAPLMEQTKQWYKASGAKLLVQSTTNGRNQAGGTGGCYKYPRKSTTRHSSSDVDNERLLCRNVF